ncbi:biotin/lipoyl-containing protein [Halobacteriovorax sp. HLS]|uniref:biotin/lipoyl-containing protein n=1 Tax=Halobacteriovorax sp. HLS TaxID=2234000 RepID=UPI000FD81BD3|nr:biotin/lipoyl-containing protein [Halobacteriovorax sp. HLS]
MKKNLIINGENVEIELLVNRDSCVEFTFKNKVYKFQANSVNDFETFLSGTHCTKVIHDTVNFVVDGKSVSITNPLRSRAKSNSDSAGSMISPMPGKILKVLVKTNDNVKKNDPLVVMEAMKMEHTIKASHDGKVIAIHCSDDQLVDGGVQLIELESEES